MEPTIRTPDEITDTEIRAAIARVGHHRDPDVVARQLIPAEVQHLWSDYLADDAGEPAEARAWNRSSPASERLHVRILKLAGWTTASEES